jgi:ketosteroid isomerase-like protein
VKRTRSRTRTALLVTLALSPPLAASAQATGTSAQQQVLEAERAFAQTMADRGLDAFATFVADDAVFFGRSVLRGKREVVEGWRGLFDGADAPFSWEPEEVEVLPSGGLAHSSGPVYNPAGERVGTFNSVWRLEPDGRWRVVFDKGCSCAA